MSPSSESRYATAERVGHAVVLITGIQAAGKSTIAQALAERLPTAVHVRGDAFRRMLVTGPADVTPNPSAEAIRQLRLRHQLTAEVSDNYFQAGFTVIAQDVILGEHLLQMTRQIRSRPLLVVVLAPTTEAIADRETTRDKTGYHSWAINELNDILHHHQTPRLGLWLDTSNQTPDQTVDEILTRGPNEARIQEPPPGTEAFRQF